MKKILITITISLLPLLLGAQTIDEAYLYSRQYYSGSARFQSMGGAFTSLGGDLSGLALNPAGLGLFRAPEVSFTPQMYFNSTSANFNGEITKDSKYEMSVNQFGFELPLVEKDGPGLRGFNIGYTYNRTNNYSTNIIMRGAGTNSSMADYWAARANGDNVVPENLGNSEWLAFLSYIIDTIPGTGGYDYATIFSDYGNNANSTYGQTIRRIINNEGYAAEHSFSAAGNIEDKFYFGFTLGISKIRYDAKYTHLESDDNMNIPVFQNFTYTDVVSTDGTGYSFKIGAIYRPIDALRLGFAFHSPTVYKINEYYYDSMVSNDDYERIENANDPFRFSYTLTTPMRLNAGISYQVGKLGIVSADYEYVNYNTSRFSRASDNYDYFAENTDIKNVYAAAHNIRLGAEMRLNSMFYLRGGYSLYGSGFASGESNHGDNQAIYAAGFGLRQSNFFFDMSYAVRSNTQKYFMYGVPEVDAVDITSNRSMVSATIGLRF